MKQLIVMLLVILAVVMVISNTVMNVVEDSLVIDERIEVITTEAGVCYVTYVCEDVLYIEIIDINGSEVFDVYYNVAECQFA